MYHKSITVFTQISQFCDSDKNYWDLLYFHKIVPKNFWLGKRFPLPWLNFVPSLKKLCQVVLTRNGQGGEGSSLTTCIPECSLSNQYSKRRFSIRLKRFKVTQSNVFHWTHVGHFRLWFLPSVHNFYKMNVVHVFFSHKSYLCYVYAICYHLNCVSKWTEAFLALISTTIIRCCFGKCRC